MIKTLHIITGLSTGGAEMMLYKIVSKSSSQNTIVVSLTHNETAPVAKKIATLGVKIYFLNFHRSSFNLKKLGYLRKIIKKEMPDVIQGWMYHGNIVATFAVFFSFRKIPVVWNIRHSLHDIKKEKPLTRLVIRLNQFLSNSPKTIIYNSYVSADQHEGLGFQKTNRAIIPNGFDDGVFSPDETVRSTLRSQFKILEKEVLIGLVARYHPMKDHALFLQAAGQLILQYPDTKFMLIGKGVDNRSSDLVDLIHQYSLEEHVLLLGERTDIPMLTKVFDISTSSSSWGEGFSNAIGEAMASGVPCVVTNVGDSKLIVGKFGVVTEPNDMSGLMAGWIELIKMGREARLELGLEARDHIQINYSLTAIANKYHALYQQLASFSAKER